MTIIRPTIMLIVNRISNKRVGNGRISSAIIKSTINGIPISRRAASDNYCPKFDKYAII